ncbi:MAG: ABC transporter ATP-binding protein [Geminicoccaceae bacterium]|nr:ABC transporter ATP-binding protein [Geminicoccaceae bacterium]MCS7266471.1 ABC transporter ATP-binding protein [Geminicoccaceae bacterium]MDW8123933.1 ABC transporter ATP-binding protein [Geminicoccaceae bacterium]MDW8340004.1 ABC transporter ATP-binding protein [Geminicoccaceae bacterium]
MAALSVNVVRKRFPALGAAPEKLVLENVRFAASEGETVAVLGPSGCGKTTLLNLVAGLDPEFEGRIERPPGRLAFVFQEPRLLPWRTVEDNLRFVLAGEADAKARIDAALAEVELPDAGPVYASRLSLGMARRVALARALVVRPSLLLLDEPFVSLDQPTAWRLRLLLLDLLARHAVTTLLVTHEPREAVMLADRILLLTAAPGRPRAELRVPLSPEERRDLARIEAVARRLLPDRPEPLAVEAA